jgi:hypothetical protein
MFCFFKVKFHTVIGVLRGTKFGTKDDAILAVGAHYDTVNTTKGKHNIWENLRISSNCRFLKDLTRPVRDNR